MCDLREVGEEEARELAWARIREHIAAAVRHELPVYGGHTRGGSTADSQAWRQASPEDLAERIASSAMAAIGPVLARAGIDPAVLSWSGPGTTVVTGSRPASREGDPGDGRLR